MSNLMQKQHTIRSVNFLNNTLFELTVERLDIHSKRVIVWLSMQSMESRVPTALPQEPTKMFSGFSFVDQGEVTTQLRKCKTGRRS